jgi:hypothetical protein
VLPLSNYFGQENVGSVISAKNFKWQDLIGKIIAIIDEGRYNSSMSSDLLKITGEETIIVEKKYSKEHILIKPLPLFITTNNLFKDLDDKINQSIYNRMSIVEFINEVDVSELSKLRNFKKDIKSEEAEIIIFCNKLYFKIFKEKSRKYKNKNILCNFNENLINKNTINKSLIDKNITTE